MKQTIVLMASLLAFQSPALFASGFPVVDLATREVVSEKTITLEAKQFVTMKTTNGDCIYWGETKHSDSDLLLHLTSYQCKSNEKPIALKGIATPIKAPIEASSPFRIPHGFVQSLEHYARQVAEENGTEKNK